MKKAHKIVSDLCLTAQGEYTHTKIRVILCLYFQLIK